MLEFFSEHKRVSGSISIFLAVLLLPIYSFVALLVESARYQNAKEQLKELTFLGELAILADYVDFLYTKYDIYAYNGDDADKSFNAYVRSAKTAGGVDTTKMNKLFGLNLEQCSIEGMYSVADPTVLEYQIKQSGRFSMPADILSKITLKSLFDDFNKKFKKINKVLNILNAGADAISDASSILVNSKKILEETDKLDNLVKDYNEKYDDFLEKYNKVDWSKVSKQALSSSTKSAVGQIQKNSNKIKVYEELIPEMESVSASIEAYFNLESSKRVNHETYKDKDTKVKTSEYLADLLKKFSEVGFVKVTVFNNYEDYKKAIDELKKDKKDSEAVVASYKNVSGVYETVEAYKELRKTAKEMDTSYGKYTSALTGLIKDINDTVENIDKVNAIQEEMKISELNESGKEASNTNAAAKKESDAEQKAKLEKQAKEQAKKRLENYQEAKKNKDYSNIGSNVMANFTQSVTETAVNDWKTRLDTAVNKMPDVGDCETGEELFDASQKIRALNIPSDYKNIVSLSDFYSMNGLQARNTKDGNIAFELFINLHEKDENSDAEIDESYIEKIYGPLIESDIDISVEMFPVDKTSNKAYYYSKNTVVLLLGFLAAQVKLEHESNKGGKNFFDILKTLIKAFENLSPDNPLFNNHVGNNSDNLNNTSGISYPSQVKFPLTNSGKQTEAHNYATSVLGDSGGKIDANTSIDYYADKSTTTLYDDVFGGRDPGKSIQDLVEASGETLDAVDTFARSLYPIKIIKLLRSVWKFIKSIGKFIKALIEFVIDIIQVISAVLNDIAHGTIKCLTYIIDQFYYAYYAEQKFTSRQTAEPKDYKVKDAFEHDCSIFNMNKGSCYTGEVCFDACELEYIMMGSPCETINQKQAYYAIFVIRMLLNYSLCQTDAIISPLQAIPIVGVFIPFIADFIESRLDIMFMLFGESVPLFKSQLSLTHIGDFIDHVEEILKREVNAAKQGKLTYKYEKGPDGNRYRKYNDKSTNDMIKEQAKKDFNINAKEDEGKLKFDYNRYILVLTFLYPANVKLQRMADLMQMHGMENDPTFDLKKCYTYVYANVEAKFSPLLPLLADGYDLSVVPTLKDLQYNGY